MTSQKFSDNNSENPKIQIENKDGAGLSLANANQIAGGIMADLENVYDLLAQFNSSIHASKIGWPELRPNITLRSAAQVNELSKINLVEVTPKTGLPILAEIGNGYIAATAMSRGAGGEVLETLMFSATIFQRVIEPFGETPETRLILGSLDIGLERFSEMFELETGHRGAEKELARLAKEEKAKRLAFQKRQADAPKPVNPAVAQAQIIADGFKLAMEQMGLAKTATAKTA